MKTKTALAAILILLISIKGYSQDNPKTDDKNSVMNEIENIKPEPCSLQKWWDESKEVEYSSLFFGYISYGVPWGTPVLHGGTLGLSLNHVMINLDLGMGSLIDESAYDNLNEYKYLKANSTQSFGFLSVHYYMIKYLSFGIGLGYHSELQKISSSSIETHEGYSIETDKIAFENKGFFGLRFGARAYIPVSDKLSFYLSCNYEVMPSNVRKSKLDLGIGLKIALE